jgi:DNA-binding XRE family transcriptional regulator
MTPTALKQLRQSWNLTQSALSTLMGVPLRTYQGWEGGRQVPAWVNKMVTYLAYFNRLSPFGNGREKEEGNEISSNKRGLGV